MTETRDRETVGKKETSMTMLEGRETESCHIYSTEVPATVLEKDYGDESQQRKREIKG